MLNFNQSVAKHVRRFGTNIFTPSCTRFIIFVFDFFNTSSVAGPQKNDFADASLSVDSTIGAWAMNKIIYSQGQTMISHL